MFSIILFFACSDKSSTDSSTPDTAVLEDTAVSEPETPIDLAELNGTEPSEMIPVPEFIAVNFDETVRDQSHLIGAPTVLWFYPAADTPG